MATLYETKSSSPSSSRRKQRKKETKYIPLDIMEQILLRLPAKSVIRFRLVCKLWCRIISDPSFPQKHLNFVNKNPSLYLVGFSFPDNKISIYENELFKRYLWTPVQVKYPQSRLVGICNGLVCMHANDKILVFNPATREAVSLPNPSFGMSYSHLGLSRRGEWNFGFNPNANEYKIMHLYEEGNPNQTECAVKVFTLGKDTKFWRPIKGGPALVLLSQAINIGANMYWKTADYFSNNSVFSILLFNLSEEKFGRIEAPKEEFHKSLIMDLHGRLGWVSVNSPGQNRTIKLWTLDNEPENNKYNWTLLRTIQLSDFMLNGKSSFRFWYVRNSKRKIMIQLGGTKLEYYCLDFTMKNDIVEFVLSELPDSDSPVLRTSYVESLISLP